MPPARAMAPPLKPVPAPRPTIGSLCSRASFTIADHIFGRSRENHQFRAATYPLRRRTRTASGRRCDRTACVAQTALRSPSSACAAIGIAGRMWRLYSRPFTYCVMSSLIQFSASANFRIDLAVFDDVGFGDLERAVVRADIGSGIARGLERHRNALQEVLVLLLVLVDADRHHHYARLGETLAGTGSSDGISCTQGAHQLAQKFSTSTLPPKRWV